MWFLGPTESFTKWHLNRFSRFCRAHYCDRQTDQQTTLLKSVTTGCIYVRSIAMWPNNDHIYDTVIMTRDIYDTVIMTRDIYDTVIMTRHHCESSHGSTDECRLSAGCPPILRPSQPTSTVSPPHPPSPFVIITQPES